jgi:hypothetical protein
MSNKKDAPSSVKSALRLGKKTVTGWLEVRSGIFLEKMLSPVPPGRLTTGGPGRVCLVEGSDPSIPYSTTTLARRRQSGSALYALYIGDEVATYGWLADAGTKVGIVHELYLKVPDKTVYIWDCVTRPSFRGQGCFPRFLTGTAAACRAGPVLAQVAVDSRNAASQRALAKAGFKPCFRYTSIKCFGRVVAAYGRDHRGLRSGQSLFDGACRLTGTRIS